MGLFGSLFGSSMRSVDPDGAQELLGDGALLVDVRERSEWDAGHAPKAKHHPLGGLRESMGDLPVERTLVVVCRSGNRSARATKLLSKAGYDAVNLSGGMMAWQAAGQPVVSARGRGAKRSGGAKRTNGSGSRGGRSSTSRR